MVGPGPPLDQGHLQPRRASHYPPALAPQQWSSPRLFVPVEADRLPCTACAPPAGFHESSGLGRSFGPGHHGGTESMSVTGAPLVEATLVERLRAAAAVLLETSPPPEDSCSREAGILLDRLVRAVQAECSHDRVWLLSTAMFGAYPTADDVLAGTRFLQLAPPTECALWLLDRALDRGTAITATSRLRVVADRVVVDVDHSARHDLHTGIQQVVRRSLPFWERDHPVLAVAWTTGWSGLRPLSETERCRVLHWGGPDAPAPGPTSPPGPAGGPSSDPEVLVVPWRTVVVIMETPASQACDRLAALAQYSGNAVVAVGYDCIPVVSADLVPAVETQRFARYLSVLKHARRIAGISRSATTEFRGFGAALPAQGLPGPTIIECPLPTQAVTAQTGTTQTADAPRTTALVLSVGSLEPRKNHLALLYAAERLWRDHLHFELLLIAGSGWGDELPARIAHLQAQGRPLSVRTDVSDADLAAAYRQARFSVFASLHEGYGLPVAESLAYGTPVITTNYGSTGDIAAAGGAILIDPRDDDALTDAMRGLLTDDHRLDSLRHQLHTLPTRTWEHYAHDLWHHLVQPELPCPPTPSVDGPTS